MPELKITKENFQKEVVNSSQPVLLDFWASWCGPCRMVAPVLAEIAVEYEGKIKVGKVNVDEEQELSAAFRIASIPTLMVIKDGKVVNSMVGVRSKAQIVSMF